MVLKIINCKYELKITLIKLFDKVKAHLADIAMMQGLLMTVVKVFRCKLLHLYQLMILIYIIPFLIQIKLFFEELISQLGVMNVIESITDIDLNGFKRSHTTPYLSLGLILDIAMFTSFQQIWQVFLRLLLFRFRRNYNLTRKLSYILHLLFKQNRVYF